MTKVDDQDWKMAMNSEIFREFVSNELRKEAEKEREDMDLIRTHLADQIRAAKREELEVEAEIEARSEALKSFGEFEKAVKASPEMLAKFKNAKAALMQNPSLMDKVDPTFIKGLMMIDLGE